jgi:nitronate monooxygenase
MSLPEIFNNRLSVPLIAAPMFLASGPELVIECCKAGVVGTFPALNPRTTKQLDEWLTEIDQELEKFEQETGQKPAPYGVNLIVHKSNPRLLDDLAIMEKHQVKLIVTSLSCNAEVIDRIHAYGGFIFHDVVNVRFAKKAASMNVDGLIAVCGGAGGHAGHWNPLALINGIRQFFDKTVLLAGCVSSGSDIAAAQMMGADMAYAGTRFLATKECCVVDDYKDMIVSSSAADIVYTPAISGVPASFMRASVADGGYDPDDLTPAAEIDFGAEMVGDDEPQKKKAWKDIWSAGQGVEGIAEVLCTGELIARMKKEYQQAHQTQAEKAKAFLP